MANSVTTVLAREKVAKARAGDIILPKIVQMAFGSGGVDEIGTPLPPSENSNSLGNELLRKNIDSYSYPIATTCKYRGVIEKTELIGANINEIALVDEDGDLVAIKTFTNKSKDGDMEMIFDVNDEF